MNKKLMKVLSILLISIMMVSTMSTMVLAAGEESSDKFTPSEVTGSMTGGMETASSQIQSLGNNVVGVLRTVGIVLSVVVLVVIGIKYMMGSPEEKSEYKKSMMPYIIGAALIFAASMFAEVIYGFFSGFSINS